jgi:hypothetical protein
MDAPGSSDQARHILSTFRAALVRDRKWGYEINGQTSGLILTKLCTDVTPVDVTPTSR